MHFQLQSRLASLPHELLVAIAYALTCLSPLGPPHPLLHLLSTCSLFNHALKCPLLFKKIFLFKFDADAVTRRAFSPDAEGYTERLEAVCRALQLLRTANVFHIDAENALFEALVLIIEDEGKNVRQLEEYGGAYAFARKFLIRRAYEGREQNDGWPHDTIATRCAMAVMWMLTTEDKLRSETPEQRQQLIQVILPFVLNPFRYPTALVTPAHFTLPVPSNQQVDPLSPSHQTAHGQYPILPWLLSLFPYYSARPSLSPPLATTIAKLLYFSRLLPHPLATHLPRDRAEAHARGNFDIGMTQEDLAEWNWGWYVRCPRERERQVSITQEEGEDPPTDRNFSWGIGDDEYRHPVSSPTTPPPPIHIPFPQYAGKAPPLPPRRPGAPRSARWDADWWRMRMCGEPRARQPSVRWGRLYEYGSMEGLWQGCWMFIDEAAMLNLLHTGVYPSVFPPNPNAALDQQAHEGFSERSLGAYPRPFYMRLRELHCVQGWSKEGPVPVPGSSASSPSAVDAANLANAYLPCPNGSATFVPGVREAEGEVVVVCPSCAGGDVGRYGYRRFAAASTSTWGEAEGGEGDEWGGWPHEPEGCVECEARGRIREWEARKKRASCQGDVEVDEEERERVFARVLNELGGQDEYEEADEEGHATFPYASDPDWSDSDSSADSVDAPGNWLPTVSPDERVRVPAPPYPQDIGRPGRGRCSGVRDVILEGETDERHGQAWNHAKFYGRVRQWDGLIVLLQKSRDSAIGYHLLYGYLVGGDNFVGNWRITAADASAPAWEGPFVMSRRAE